MPDPTHYDVIIAGAGPAGSQAAITLSRAGRKVLVLEKKAFPRSKPCGGCLSRRVERFLPRHFLDAVVEGTISRVLFRFHPHQEWEYASDQPVAYVVRRERFDLLLCREASQAGAEVRFQTPLTSFQEEAESIEAVTPDQRFRGRFLILAQGAYDTLPPALRSSRSSLTYQGLEGRLKRTETAGPWPSDTVAIHLGSVAFGYGWVFPCGDSQSVGISFWPKKEKHPQWGIRRFQQSCPGLPDRPPLKGHPIPCFDGRPRAYSRGRVLWAGDAARLVDPFLGEGIYYALWSGQLGAQTIHQALEKGRPDLGAYDQALAQTLVPEFGYALILARWVYTWPRLFWWLLKRHPGIMTIYFRILRGQESYGGFFWEFQKRMRRATGLHWILREPRRNVPF
jgi:geranylgeranyl reductase family protein